MYHWDWSVITSNWHPLLLGVLMTFKLVTITMLTGLVAGLLVAIAAGASWRPVRALAITYTEVFRDTPLLLQLVFFYRATSLSSFWAGYVGLTLNLTAFLAEIYRSGIGSIDKGQREAGLSIGMTSRQVLWRIIIPQAFMRVVPQLGTFWVSLFRDSALVSIIGVSELTHSAQQIAVSTYRPFEAFTALALIYMVITYPQARLVSWLHEKFRVRE